MKILAVDDDNFILEILSIMACRAGFNDVSTVSSAERALEILVEGDVTYDCLMYDINMPGMDGIELCALTRTMPTYAKTPIIMLTAMSEKSFVDRAFAAGATDYAIKPFDIVELSARLRMAAELVAARSLGTLPVSQDEAQAESRNCLLEDEVQIIGVKNLIEYVALRNYLSQLSIAGIGSSQVLAFKIDQIEKIHARASSDEFLYVLTEVASAIFDALQYDSPMLAYSGNGTYLAVSGKPTMEHSGSLELKIQHAIDDRDLQYDNGDPLDIDISVSNPVRPSSSRLQRGRRTFERAIARVENRVARKQTEHKPPHLRFVK